MASKIAAFIVTFLTNLVIGVAIFFFMLVAMNGFHESDANWGLGVYIALALSISVVMSVLAYIATGYLIRKELHGAIAVLVAVPVFSVIGGCLKFVCCFIGIGVADYVRVNY